MVGCFWKNSVWHQKPMNLSKQHFVIPVGQYFTGEMTRLVLANDDDASAVGQSVFSNIRVYENESEGAEGESAASAVTGILLPRSPFSNPRDEFATGHNVQLSVTGESLNSCEFSYRSGSRKASEIDGSVGGALNACAFSYKSSYEPSEAAVDLLLAGLIPPPPDSVAAATDQLFNQDDDPELDSLLEDEWHGHLSALFGPKTAFTASKYAIL